MASELAPRTISVGEVGRAGFDKENVSDRGFGSQLPTVYACVWRRSTSLRAGPSSYLLPVGDIPWRVMKDEKDEDFAVNVAYKLTWKKNNKLSFALLPSDSLLCRIKASLANE